MNFLLTYKDGIAKGSVKNKHIDLAPYLHLSGASYLDTYKNYIYTISDGGISVYKNQNLIYQDTQFEYKPSHIVYLSKHKLIITSNYHLGLASLYSIKNDTIKFIESIKYPEDSKIHQAYYDEKRQLLLIVNLGLDAVYIYKIDDQSLRLIKTLNFPHQSGPRHLCVSKKGFIYIVSEYSNEVFVYNKDLILIQIHKTLTFNYEKSDSSAIRLSHKETSLFVINRLEDYVTSFNIAADGTLDLVEISSTHGKHARDFNISYDDSLLMIANKDSNSLTLFEHSLGKLTHVATTAVTEPTMIKITDHYPF